MQLAKDVFLKEKMVSRATAMLYIMFTELMHFKKNQMSK